MGIEFRALNEKDIASIGNIVTSNTTVDAYDLVSSTSFLDAFDYTGIEKSLAQMHTRKVIKLAAPTFNHVLGRSNCNLLARLLNVPSKQWESIVSMKTIYDLDTEEYVSIDEASEQGNYLYGARIAERLIDNLDIEQEKLQCLLRALGTFCKQGTKVSDVVTIDKHADEDAIQLVDGYYAHDTGLSSSLKRGVNYEDIEKGFPDAIFPHQDTRYTYLRNLNGDKSRLYGMLNYYVVVVPEDMRPNIDGQEHKLTKLYVRVLQANYQMTLNLKSTTPKVISQAYWNLENSVRKLQYKNQGSSKDVKPDDLSILERIKTKKGQIRMRNLGKRQDYSGRAVVCINPYLPVDVIRIPRYQLPKLLEYHILPYLAENIKNNNKTLGDETHLPNIYDKLRLADLRRPDVQDEMIRLINEHGLLDEIPLMLGRQPTLHKQSLQGFYIELSDLQAIEVNPLVCPAFNMDFDGDQAHEQVPLSPNAIREVRDLVMTTQNLFLPKTGECTTEPRQDMLYGLWMCTRNTYTLGQIVQTYETLNAIRNDVIGHKVKVWDTVYCMEIGTKLTAGDGAFMACFPKGDVIPRGTTSADGMLPVTEIGKKTITQYVDHLLRIGTNGQFVHAIGSKYASAETFVGAINRLVELGFKVARLYPPNMSLIIPDNPIPAYDNALPAFYTSLDDINLYYNLGMETADNYKLAFSKSLQTLMNVRESNVNKKLGDDNGYVKLSVSGARGNTSNLVQAFSIKGQVKKNDTESFDALLVNSYATQLTPLEHYVAAYGGRQGQIDKSLKTGDTGYAMRKMWHATQGSACVCEDCKTTDGIKISKHELIVFSDQEDDDKINQDVSNMFEHAITGRYQAGSNGRFISSMEAKRLANDPSVDEIFIRSPITCKNPCCAKCYGIEWSTHKLPVVGTPTGIIDAQCIGEPGTQLTLKTFQKGGVVGKADVTSAFDKVNKYLHVADLAKASKEGKYPGYDPVAWDTGEVKTESASDMDMLRVSIGKNKKKILVPRGIKLKTYVKRGEGLSYIHGDYDINEILEYSGIEAAQRYLMFKLFALYRSEVKIKMVHFEVLVASMTRYMILETDRDDLMVGQYATAQELYRGNTTNTRYIPRLIGVKDLPNASHEALDAIIMEGHVEGLSRICLLGMSDSLTKPINRMVLGQSIINGSAVPGFIEKRKERI